MNLFRNASIQRKQMLIILLTSGAALLLACIAFSAYEVAIFRKEMVRNISTLAEIVGNNSTAGLEFNDPKAVEETMLALKAEPGVIGAGVYSKDGQVFATYDRPNDRIQFSPPAEPQKGYGFKSGRLEMYRPIVSKGEIVGTVYVESDLQALYSRLQQYVLIVLGVFFAATLVAFVISARLQRLISEPILQLVKATREVAASKNYSTRARKQTEDELGTLVDGFNEMLEQIQSRDAELQRANATLEQRVEERTRELEQSVSLLNATLESTTDGILVIDSQGTVTDFNEQFTKLWKIPAELASSRNNEKMIDFVVPSLRDSEVWLARLQGLRTKPEVESFDLLEFKDGRIFEQYSKPQRVGERCVGRVWSFRDITERRRAENELRWKTAFLEAQVTSSWDGILVVDKAGKKMIQNQRVAELWKIPREIVEDADDSKQVEYATNQCKDPAKFVEKVQYLYSRPSEVSRDEVELKDGTVLERYSYPVTGEDGTHYGRLWTFRDITERKRAEEKLKRTEELYRRAIAGADAVPYAYDYKSRTYLFMGQGIKGLIGYEASEVTQDLWGRIIQESIMGGETAGLDKAEAARRVKDGELRTWRCDMRILTRDGKSRWLSDASVQNVDEAGKPIGSMGILQDITERKRAEITALAFSKLGERLSAAANPAQAAGFISEVAEQLFGWDAFWLKLYAPETNAMQPILSVDTINGQRIPQTSSGPEEVTLRQRRVMQKGAELILRDTPAFSPDATPFGDLSRPSASIMVAPIRYGTTVIGLLSAQSYQHLAYSQQELVTLQAIADQCGGALARIRADETLRLLSSAIEQSADNIIVTQRNGSIIYANPAFLKLTGFTKEEVVGQTPRIIKSGGHPLSFYRQLWNTIQGGKSFRAEFINRKKNGEEFYEEKSVTPVFDAAGEITHFVASGRDVTQRKKTEEELEEAHKQLLETSRRAGMAEVASNVLHNVGNVLNSVNVSAALLADRIRGSRISSLVKATGLMRQHSSEPGQLAKFMTEDAKGRQLPNFLFGVVDYLTEEQKALLKELDSLGKNIEHIKDIVAMQQSYAKVSGVSETIPPAELIEDALRMNEAAFARHQVQVIREYADVPPISVEKHKVLQILVNLMRNAKYAMEDGGKTEKPVRLRLERKDGQFIRISVIDNGVGIPPENLTRIFNHGFTTRKHGHGFGLHSGALAAKELGGSLSAHSDGPGKGAMFTLELPIGNSQLPPVRNEKGATA